MKKIFFLLFPLFVFADIKFSSASSLDKEAKIYATMVANSIEDVLQITLIKNFESRIYEEEAALYALKNGIIKFTIVNKNIFEKIGLESVNTHRYGFEPIAQKNDFVVLVQSRFFNSISSAKKQILLKTLDQMPPLLFQ